MDKWDEFLLHYPTMFQVNNEITYSMEDAIKRRQQKNIVLSEVFIQQHLRLE
jgi:hypothetical protein